MSPVTGGGVKGASLEVSTSLTSCENSVVGNGYQTRALRIKPITSNSSAVICCFIIVHM